MINLTDLKPFAIGGRRECYVHPHHPDRCLKVIREDFAPSKLMEKAGFLRSIRKSERDFDENASDLRVLQGLEEAGDAGIWEHLPRCHGMEATSRGGALSVELFRDADGLISRTLLDHLTRQGMDAELDGAISRFCGFWKSHSIATRDLGLHNIVVRRQDGESCLKLIDGFGSTQNRFLSFLYPQAARSRSVRKADRLREEIRALLENPEALSAPIKRGALLNRM